MTTRINGGIITDQMLSGSFRYFKMTGNFAYTIGTGATTIENTYTVPETILPGQAISGDKESPKTYNKRVAAGQPVPNSVADRVFKVITERCTVLLISLIGDGEIHFIVEAGTCGWTHVSDMMLAVATSGHSGTSMIGTKVIGDPAIPDATTVGAAPYNLSGILITEVNNPVFA